MRRIVLALACMTAVTGLAATATAATTSARTASRPQFDAPVKLTVNKYFGGYEPGLTVDRFNNVVVTAHKQNHGDVVSPDAQAAGQARAQSWLWTSKDGKTFHDLPGLTPLQEQNAEFGDEGDLARDDTGHVYFVDTNVTDDSFSRYKATGNGKIALETTRPLGPFGEPIDDRPWVTAHGDGVVMYIGNEGDKVSYPGGRGGDGAAYGPGRYTVYMSYDHGNTFDLRGITLADSGWCRPAADHRQGSKELYVLCTNDGGADDTTTNAGDPGYEHGTLWAFASHDDGRTWSRSRMGSYNAKADKIATWPSVSVASNGTIYALYNANTTVHSQVLPKNVPDPLTGSDDPGNSHMYLYTSTTKGRTWTVKDVTPRPGLIRYTWLDVAPNGTLGIGYYYRPNTHSDWHVYAGTAQPGEPFNVTQVSSQSIASRNFGSAFGDFFQIAFGPDSKLNIVWTALNTDLKFEGLNSDIYYAKQR